jgi:hypothetical protein
VTRHLSRAFAAARTFWLAPEHPDSAAFLRLALGGLGLVQLAVLWPHLLELYGNFGFVQWVVVETSNSAWVPSIGKLALVLENWGITSSTAVYLVFGLYGASLVGLVIGYRTKLFAVIAWLSHAVTLNSGFFSLYGVDTMMHILFFYLVFSPAGAKWSVDAYLGRVSSAPSSGARIARRLIQLHLCIIYVNTGVAKAQGEQWWNGEAIWRTVMQPQFNVFDLSWLAAHPALATVIGWSVLLVELGYAVFIWIPATRRPALVATVLMHAGIAITMQLWLFSLMMIAFNLAAFGWSQVATRATPERTLSAPTTQPSLAEARIAR